jgi:hypothetical protein
MAARCFGALTGFAVVSGTRVSVEVRTRSLSYLVDCRHRRTRGREMQPVQRLVGSRGTSRDIMRNSDGFLWKDLVS